MRPRFQHDAATRGIQIVWSPDVIPVYEYLRCPRLHVEDETAGSRRLIFDRGRWRRL
jgi:hypothetical protein